MIKKGLIVILVCFLTFFAASFSTQAQSQQGDMGIGIQSSYAFWGSGGLSFIYDMRPDASVQAILGTGGRGRNAIEGRYLHRFRQEAYWDGYAFGSAGIYSDSDLGFLWGGGVGIEYDLRGLEATFPPVSINADVGAMARDGLEDFDVQLRTGFHYRF